MKWIGLFLAVLIVLPRPVWGAAMAGGAPCSCACCHDSSGCGCQADRTPSVQSWADMPGEILVKFCQGPGVEAGKYVFFYNLEIERLIFHPPDQWA